MKYWLIISIIFLITIGCSEETEVSTESFIDDDLTEYFMLFETEASNRGFLISTMGVAGYIQNLEDDIAGQCATYNDGAREIRIDRAYWSRASLTEKEMLVFHELGHCVLGRGHHNDSDTRGFCVSIMNSGIGECVSRYNRNNRELYLDELFYNK